MTGSRNSRLSGLVKLATIAGIAATLAACTPTVEFTTSVPIAPGVTLNLTMASGFRGTVDFRCRQAPSITIIGNETSIVLIEGTVATTLDGGPYRYTAPGVTVEFEESYNELVWTSVAGRRFCRG
ncbi:MAG: hypothetical protein KIT43_07980 [Bauldia sp.]|nr:hypothetical protein [Bauldia sp.]MCW5719098.1 hypothetical protein [Bauldia sp.]